MKRLQILLLIVATLGIVVSCDKEQLDPNIDPNTPTGELTTVNLTIKVAPMVIQGANKAGSKTISTDDGSESGVIVTYGADADINTAPDSKTAEEVLDSKIHNITVLQFNASGGRQYSTFISNMAEYDDMAGTYNLPLTLVEGTGMKIYILANMGDQSRANA